MDRSDDKTVLEILGIILAAVLFAGDILYTLGLVSLWLVFLIALPLVVAEANYLNHSYERQRKRTHTSQNSQ